MKSETFVVGVDLGGTNIRSAAVDSSGKILGEDNRPTGAERLYENIAVDIARSIGFAVKNAGLKISDIRAGGIGTPGPADPVTGMVLSPPNLPTFRGVPLRDDLGALFPFSLANDADCFLLGEYWLGAAKDAQAAVGLTIGTDIGIGYAIRGKLIRGMGMGPEICHNPSPDNTGRLCSICGRRGCPGSYLSGKGVVKTALESGLKIENAAELCELLVYGSEHASVVVRCVGEHLGRVLGGVVNIFHPEAVVVGGSISKLGEPLFTAADFMMRQVAFLHLVDRVKLVSAALGDNAGVLGAARLALDSIEKGDEQ